jgi:hypothetical protein
MPEFTHPSKDQVRAYMQRRSRDASPPPSPEEIRRELGWGLSLPAFKTAPTRA